MEVVVKTGPIRHAKLQSDRNHQQTNTQLFTGPEPVVKLSVGQAQCKLRGCKNRPSLFPGRMSSNQALSVFSLSVGFF